MKPKPIHTAIFASIGMLLLILDSRTALSGAAEGIRLCIQTVIPSLFPFFVLSILLTGSLTGRNVTFLYPLGRLTGIPHGSESILLTGLLGGYPVGGQAVASAYASGAITGTEAKRMMAFCNNAGPSFIFGMAASLFPHPIIGWALWGIHIAGAILVAIMMPGKSHRSITLTRTKDPSFASAVTSAVRIMASVCGWVVLFRVILTFLGQWFFWLFPKPMQVILTGALELANGCYTLSMIENPGLRFVICSAMLAFGGICVGMQTASVAEIVDRSLYFPGKLLQTFISISLAILLQSLLPAHQRWDVPRFVCFLPLVFLPIFFVLRQKSSSIPAKAGV